MKRAILLTVGLFLFAGWGTSASQATKTPPRTKARHAAATSSQAQTSIRHVLIVSVDGLMPESYTAPDRHTLKVPTLREMGQHGAASEGVRGVIPAVIYPSHTTIATGFCPRTHGIIANAVFDPLGTRDRERFWYSDEIHVPTLWDVARARGLRTALISWPVTVGTSADFVLPEFWRGTGPHGAKLLRAISTPGLFATVENRFPRFLEGIAPPNTKDEALTDVAVQVIQTARPHLLMLHIFEVDHWQHEKGPWSPEAIAAIENADQQIARVIEVPSPPGSGAGPRSLSSRITASPARRAWCGRPCRCGRRA